MATEAKREAAEKLELLEVAAKLVQVEKLVQAEKLELLEAEEKPVQVEKLELLEVAEKLEVAVKLELLEVAAKLVQVGCLSIPVQLGVDSVAMAVCVNWVSDAFERPADSRIKPAAYPMNNAGMSMQMVFATQWIRNAIPTTNRSHVSQHHRHATRTQYPKSGMAVTRVHA